MANNRTPDQGLPMFFTPSSPVNRPSMDASSVNKPAPVETVTPPVVDKPEDTAKLVVAVTATQQKVEDIVTAPTRSAHAGLEGIGDWYATPKVAAKMVDSIVPIEPTAATNPIATPAPLVVPVAAPVSRQEPTPAPQQPEPVAQPVVVATKPRVVISATPSQKKPQEKTNTGNTNPHLVFPGRPEDQQAVHSYVPLQEVAQAVQPLKLSMGDQGRGQILPLGELPSANDTASVRPVSPVRPPLNVPVAPAASKTASKKSGGFWAGVTNLFKGGSDVVAVPASKPKKNNMAGKAAALGLITVLGGCGDAGKFSLNNIFGGGSPSPVASASSDTSSDESTTTTTTTTTTTEESASAEPSADPVTSPSPIPSASAGSSVSVKTQTQTQVQTQTTTPGTQTKTPAKAPSVAVSPLPEMKQYTAVEQKAAFGVDQDPNNWWPLTVGHTSDAQDEHFGSIVLSNLRANGVSDEELKKLPKHFESLPVFVKTLSNFTIEQGNGVSQQLQKHLQTHLGKVFTKETIAKIYNSMEQMNFREITMVDSRNGNRYTLPSWKMNSSYSHHGIMTDHVVVGQKIYWELSTNRLYFNEKQFLSAATATKQWDPVFADVFGVSAKTAAAAAPQTTTQTTTTNTSTAINITTAPSASPSASPTGISAASASPSATPSASPSASASPVVSASPSLSPAPRGTVAPSAQPTLEPIPHPSTSVTSTQPMSTPRPRVTARPTTSAFPTATPTPSPSETPNPAVSLAPSNSQYRSRPLPLATEHPGATQSAPAASSEPSASPSASTTPLTMTTPPLNERTGAAPTAEVLTTMERHLALQKMEKSTGVRKEYVIYNGGVSLLEIRNDDDQNNPIAAYDLLLDKTELRGRAPQQVIDAINKAIIDNANSKASSAPQASTRPTLEVQE